MSSSRPSPQYNSQALTPSPLRRKSFVPANLDLDTKSSASQETLAKSGTVGVKRKPTPLPVTAPYPKRGMTPLCVTKATGDGSFGRLAPLPAPKFRSERTSGETESNLRKESATLARLRIDKEESDAILGEEEEAVDVSPGGHITKRLARSRPVSQELLDSTSTGSRSLFHSLSAPKPKRRSTTSSVAFPTTHSNPTPTSSSPMASPRLRQRIMHASNLPASSSRGKREDGKSLVRTRKPSISQLRNPDKRVESSGSATLFFGPAISRHPPASATPARPRPATIIAFEPPMNATSTPAHRRPQPVPARSCAVSRHSYAGPIFDGHGQSGVGGRWQVPTMPSSPISESVPTHRTQIGDISDEDESDFAPVEVDMRAMNVEGAEDLFFSSSSFGHSCDIGPDTSFGWDSTPIVSSPTVNVMQSTPSPRSKISPVKSKLEKKYRPRDSGIVLSEDESNNTHVSPDFVPPVQRHRYTLGRSESVSLSMPRASTSVSTLGSGSSDQELITPIFGPSTSSGWPPLAPSSTASSLSVPDVSSVDAFILRTLMQAAQRGEHAQPRGADGGAGMRPPGTPQKRVKTAAGIWCKIGFDFGNDEEEDDTEVGGAKGQAEKVKTRRNKKAPRKSLPAAFPLLSKTGHGHGRTPGAEDSDEEFGQYDTSPTERSKISYDGLGLGRPSVSKASGSRWLLRRSSSGAISSAPSESGNMSGDSDPHGAASTTHPSTPTYSTQTFPTQVKHPEPSHIEPDGVELVRHLDDYDARLTNEAPTDPTAVANRLWTRATPTSRRWRAWWSFEREFVEIGELGTGEFGKVMKVRRQHSASISGTSGNITAVKKSKAFEGVRHRLRLREEVEILQHLSNIYAVENGLTTRHPNVLAYVDSWEEDEALYIQTELCEFGNFAHFLWEYGRAFPQLDEARVWKIIADLSNGLHFIHDAGVIHLDLKPANIFITREGRFKIGDFGMASLWPRPVLTSPAGLEVSLRTVRMAFEREGDKLYLAPEVLQGRYGKAADMFSFGITILETTANIVVPGEGEPWHRLRKDDLSQVDFPTDTSRELRELLMALLRSNAGARMDSGGVCAHPVVARTRAAMERLMEEAQRAGEPSFAASPLASVPVGFLAEVLGHDPTAVTAIERGAEDVMDVGA
ncbi:hypothetical protein F5148DRAFT_1282301 [Russula earlei]|uniref:Uncharacterized protein n=1 Tax=Russula earlei TaxID=71964 RepID=A0ACC0UEF2_9AGAM|nr:hypothetical protein F5148DRAFT_1282301 [Russula earlei]